MSLQVSEGQHQKQEIEAEHARIADYEARAGRWLADGNAAREGGNAAKAEECYRKSQFWLDRANKARERA